VDTAQPDPEAALVSVFATSEFAVVPLARAALDDAGIDYMVQESGISSEIFGQRSTMSIGETETPVRFLVRAEDESRALDVLRDFLLEK
jgi:hypothetical protein